MVQVQKGATGLRRVILAAGYSWKGFVAAFKYEAAFRQELAVVILGFGLAIWLAESTTEFLLLVIPLLLMLLAELANSAIEATVDRFGDEYHELSGRAKDMGSATTFVSFLIAGMSWTIIMVEKFFF